MYYKTVSLNHRGDWLYDPGSIKDYIPCRGGGYIPFRGGGTLSNRKYPRVYSSFTPWLPLSLQYATGLALYGFIGHDGAPLPDFATIQNNAFLKFKMAGAGYKQIISYFIIYGCQLLYGSCWYHKYNLFILPSTVQIKSGCVIKTFIMPSNKYPFALSFRGGFL